MPRYVILEHDHPARHWDFLLECGDVLLAWRLSAPPGPGGPVDAEQSFDHRPLYLDYEGPISGGRGRVTRWDAGTFEWEAREPGRVAVRLAGVRLRGVFRLERLDGAAWRGAFSGC
jgi:DNA polymerase Ligase (LigD)